MLNPRIHPRTPCCNSTSSSAGNTERPAMGQVAFPRGPGKRKRGIPSARPQAETHTLAQKLQNLQPTAEYLP